MISRCIRLHILVLFAAVLAFEGAKCAAIGQTSREVRWIDSQTDATLFASIKQAFISELEPDDPAKVAPYVADRFKYIARIGISGSSAIVVIGERENKNERAGDYFQAYNYDLKSGQKSKISGFGGRVWRFLSFANFDASPVPDIVFRYFDCTECEATLFLGSFRYDALTGKWRVRMWGPKDDDNLEIGSDNQFGDDGVYASNCVYRVGDFGSNGFDQVVVWCRETNLDNHKSDDWTQFYSATQKPQLIVVSEPKELVRLHAFACETNHKSKLCRSK